MIPKLVSSTSIERSRNPGYGRSEEETHWRINQYIVDDPLS